VGVDIGGEQADQIPAKRVSLIRASLMDLLLRRRKRDPVIIKADHKVATRQQLGLQAELGHQKLRNSLHREGSVLTSAWGGRAARLVRMGAAPGGNSAGHTQPSAFSPP